MNKWWVGISFMALATGAWAQPMPVADPTMPSRGSGPFPALMETDPRIAFHVIYRPADLAGLRTRKLGVLVWGNGGCRDDGASARAHLTEIASNGYLAIAPGKLYPPGESAPRPQRESNGKYPPQATTAEQVRAGIDWALAENRRRGSRYFGRIDPTAIAVAGHSCGGLQALQVAPDPRVRTVIVHNSGIFNDGNSSITGLNLDKADLAKVHTPILYALGGPTDQATPNGRDDFRRLEHVPAALVDLPIGHGGSFAKLNGGVVAQIAVDWLEWHLRRDRAAGRTFSGPNCRLCDRTDLRFERKRLP